MSLPLLSQYLLNTPLAALPAYAETVAHFYLGRNGVAVDNLAASDFQMRTDTTEPYLQDATMVIPIFGGLTNVKVQGPSSAGATYANLANSIRMAAGSTRADRILLHVDSPGGSVMGLAGFREAITEAKTEKPVIALIDGLGASAAYWIASAADEVYATSDSIVGSIGAMGIHYDVSEQFAAQGVKPTIIHSGALKVEGNSLEPLSEETRLKFQAELDQVRQEFATDVAQSRGISVESVLATEADTFRADVALEMGLIDGIKSMAEFFTAAQATPQSRRGSQMTDETKIRADAANAERARITAIMALPQASAMPALANLLIAEGADASDAGRVLAAAHKDMPDAAAPDVALSEQLAAVTEQLAAVTAERDALKASGLDGLAGAGLESGMEPAADDADPEVARRAEARANMRLYMGKKD